MKSRKVFIELDILLRSKVILQNVYSHEYMKIRIDSDYGLPLEKVFKYA